MEGSSKLRAPMSQFIRRATGPIDLKITAGKSRDDAIKLCAKDFNALLLIDSEGVDLNTLEERVRSQIGPTSHAFFMVQLMESWFLADRETLQAYYGQGFSTGRLPANQDIEAILKADVEHGLRDATRHCSKGTYHKTDHAPDLLLQLDASAVYTACPNFRRLIDFLQGSSDT